MHDLVETFEGSNCILQSEFIIIEIITRNIVEQPHPYLSAYGTPRKEKVLFITLSPTCSSEIVHLST